MQFSSGQENGLILLAFGVINLVLYKFRRRSLFLLFKNRNENSDKEVKKLRLYIYFNAVVVLISLLMIVFAR